jgi:GntR family transcriptional regulator, transcriptional repressor for pyruvate dehydrogenase complex
MHDRSYRDMAWPRDSPGASGAPAYLGARPEARVRRQDGDRGVSGTSELVLAHVEQELAAGRLTLGGRLPAERALAEHLGISRPSVREAIRALEVLGVVRTATGSGPQAGAVIVADPAARIGAALRLHVATTGLAVSDVVQLRVLVEGWALREASGRPDESVFAAASVLLDEMDAERDPDERPRRRPGLHRHRGDAAGGLDRDLSAATQRAPSHL